MKPAQFKPPIAYTLVRPALLMCAAAALIVSSAWAQSPAAPARAASAATSAAAKTLVIPDIEGKTIDGKAFKLTSLKGKVVLVFFWSTSCAVCLDKMPELRNNHEGWSSKPFELVAVNTDAKEKDFLDYESIISRTVPKRQRFVQLWTGDASYKDNLGKQPQLPMTYLMDKNGKVVEQYVGRIPPEAWDRIADLL